MRPHTPMVIVGLTGAARSGKDTLAAHLVEEHGFTRFAFADELKEAMLDLNPIVGLSSTEWRLADVVEELGGWDDAKKVDEVRRLLQVFGTEVIRRRNPNFWIEAVAEKIATAKPTPRRIVISDVRFDNEAEWIHTSHIARNYVVRIDRDQGGLDGDNAAHSSEQGVDSSFLSFILTNNGTKEELFQKAVSRLGIATG